MQHSPDRSLDEWLAWMEAHHPRQIELGLDRVAQVARQLALDFEGVPLVTVGGTNGKGSCVAFLDAILRAAGYRVGCYTSPHLLRYNERVRIDGIPVSDEQLCVAFAAIERALHGVSLTYFEFGTLAALWLFQREQVQLDVVVLEVGLGGRLDAVNIIDADVAVVTTIDLDHQDWLGNDRESIGREKAGIFRGGRPAICVDPEPPHTVSRFAAQVGAQWLPVGAAFEFSARADAWDWSGAGLPHGMSYRDLPLPALPLPSAAGALAALQFLPLAIDEQAIRRGLRNASLSGRFQRVPWQGAEIALDVGHNPQAARWLAQRLAAEPRRTRAVFAMMADKDVDTVIAALQPHIAAWHIGALSGNARALDVGILGERLARHGVAEVVSAPTIEQAFANALQETGTGERVLVFGSFFTVAAVLARLQREGMIDGG
jgi:dihydrofolate synthase / folylpolyglutamate synthase